MSRLDALVQAYVRARDEDQAARLALVRGLPPPADPAQTGPTLARARDGLARACRRRRQGPARPCGPALRRLARLYGREDLAAARATAAGLCRRAAALFEEPAVDGQSLRRLRAGLGSASLAERRRCARALARVPGDLVLAVAELLAELACADAPFFARRLAVADAGTPAGQALFSRACQSGRPLFRAALEALADPGGPSLLAGLYVPAQEGLAGAVDPQWAFDAVAGLAPWAEPLLAGLRAPGRLDLEPRPGKAFGATCHRVAGQAFVTLSPLGTCRDAFVLAHELGHAVSLEAASRLPPPEDAFTPLAGEALAVSAELALRRLLRARLPWSASVAKALDRLELAQDLYTHALQAMLGEFEWALRRERLKTGSLAPQRVPEVYAACCRAFFGDPGPDPLLGVGFALAPLLFEAPGYVHVYAGASALARELPVPWPDPAGPAGPDGRGFPLFFPGLPGYRAGGCENLRRDMAAALGP